MRRSRLLVFGFIILLLAAVVWWFRSRHAPLPAPPPAPYVLVEPPAWLPSRAQPVVPSVSSVSSVPSVASVTPPFGTRKSLRLAPLRSDDAQAYGFGAVAVYEKGSSVSLEVFLPTLPDADGYDADIAMADGSVTTIGRMEDRGDGWYVVERDFPDVSLDGAQSLRVTARTPKEPALDGMVVAEGVFSDVMD